MLSFWDRAWAIHAMNVRDYYKEREAQRKKWADFCQKCTEEIIDECSNIANLIGDAVSKQPGAHVHKSLVDGIVQLPLYGFYLVLRMQNRMADEQKVVLSLFFKHFNLPFSMEQFLTEVKKGEYQNLEYLSLVDISEVTAGDFWVQFFKVLYRTDEDTTYISKLIDSFCSITMRFSALNGEPEDRLLSVLEIFLVNVHAQAELCRGEPDDDIDFYGDSTFVEHFEKYKEDTFKVCRMTMDEDEENLNPRDFFQSFTLGIIYQVIKRCTRKREDKIKIIDDVLNQIDTGASVDGAYIFRYMEDLQGEQTSMLAAMMHILTDIEDGNPAGWIILTRGSGTYNLNTKEDIRAVQEAMNFIIGMENYLVDKYPMSGFGQIASDYSKEVVEIINRDIDENVNIVDDDFFDNTGRNNHNAASSSSHVEHHKVERTSDYTPSEMPSVPGKDNSHEPVIEKKYVSTDKKFFKCPKCGKLIVYTSEKQYCPECFEDYDDAIVEECGIIYPRSETKYYDLGRLDKKNYLKICFLTSSNGFVFSSYTKDGVYQEDYFSYYFEVQGGNIALQDDIMDDQYRADGDYLYDPRTIYNGRVPQDQYFDGYYDFNHVVKPIRFRSNGTVQMYSEDNPNSPVADEGRYLREGNIIRTDLKDLKSGEWKSSLWLVINGRLCRDAYVSEAGYNDAAVLLTKEMPEKKTSFWGKLFGK